MGFFIVLKSVLVMMAYLVCGFLMVRSGKAHSSHAKSVSTLLIYVCGSCMVINNFLGMENSAANNIAIAKFFVATMVLQILFLCIVYIILKRKGLTKDSRYRILINGSVLGNVGFFGLPLVKALFPNEPVVAGYSSIFVMSMNIIVFTVGVAMITRDNSYISIRSIILNPTTISLMIAIPLYVFGVKLPDTLTDGIGLLSRMSVPLCMIVLGMRLASMDVISLFKQPFAYLAAFAKLVVFPIFSYMCVRYLPCFDETFKVCVLVLSAAPTGAIVLSMAEIHECEQELSANVVLLSTLLSVITMPFISLVSYI